jgi:hypothetical protein
MGKYDPLAQFLRRWRVRNDAEGVELGFAHIENIIGGLLPHAASGAEWWCANGEADCRAPHRRAWLDAGFDAIAEPSTERVFFRRRMPCPTLSGGQSLAAEPELCAGDAGNELPSASA